MTYMVLCARSWWPAGVHYGWIQHMGSGWHTKLHPQTNCPPQIWPIGPDRLSSTFIVLHLIIWESCFGDLLKPFKNFLQLPETHYVNPVVLTGRRDVWQTYFKWQFLHQYSSSILVSFKRHQYCLLKDNSNSSVWAIIEQKWCTSHKC